MPAAVRPAVGAAAAVVALTAATSAAAQPPRPTLTFDRPCYGEQEVMAFAGEQYTPGGVVALLFASAGRIGTFSLSADGAGAIGALLDAPAPDQFLDDDVERGEVSVTANDQTRLNDGTYETDPKATFGATAFTLTRTWGSVTPRKPRPGRPMRVRMHGLAEATGEPVYLHYRRGSRSLKVIRLGTLRGACGDLRTRRSGVVRRRSATAARRLAPPSIRPRASGRSPRPTGCRG